MQLLGRQRSKPDAEIRFWERLGRPLTNQAYQQLNDAPLRSRSLRLQLTLGPHSVDDLLARFMGFKRGAHLTLALLLGRQVLSRSIILELLALSPDHQRELEYFLTYHTGSVIQAQRSPRPKGLWSSRRGRVILNKTLSEFYVTDTYGDVYNGNVLAAAITALELQNDLLDLAERYRLDGQLLLSCFSELRYSRFNQIQGRVQVSRRLKALQTLYEAHNKTIPYHDLYLEEDRGKSAFIDQLLKPFERLGLITTFQGYGEYQPSEGFQILRAAFLAERDQSCILVNAKPDTANFIFLSYISALDQQSYHIYQACAATGLSKLEIQKVHSRLNLNFGFDFRSQDGGETYQFTHRPYIVMIEKRLPGVKKPRTALSTHPQQRARQRYVIEALGERLDILGSWRVEDFQSVVSEMWAQFHPDRLNKEGHVRAELKTKWVNEHEALRHAYSQKESVSPYHPSRVYVKLTDRGEELAGDLLRTWSTGCQNYQHFIENPKLLTHYFGGPFHLDRPVSEWSQADLLTQAIALLKRITPYDATAR